MLAVLQVGFLGCAGKAANQQRDPTEERLYIIGKAYGQANQRLGRPPKTFEELKPNLEPDAPADLLRSPRDGEPFVILWGLPYSHIAPGRDPFTVAAYEKNGVSGVRHVLRFPLQVLEMTDDQLSKAAFPPGHRPPG
jgi:hypothetical protein